MKMLCSYSQNLFLKFKENFFHTEYRRSFSKSLEDLRATGKTELSKPEVKTNNYITIPRDVVTQVNTLVNRTSTSKSKQASPSSTPRSKQASPKRHICSKKNLDTESLVSPRPESKPPLPKPSSVAKSNSGKEIHPPKQKLMQTYVVPAGTSPVKKVSEPIILRKKMANKPADNNVVESIIEPKNPVHVANNNIGDLPVAGYASSSVKSMEPAIQRRRITPLKSNHNISRTNTIPDMGELLVSEHPRARSASSIVKVDDPVAGKCSILSTRAPASLTS
jgi:hypothetical protein